MTRGLNNLRGALPADNPYDLKFSQIDLNPERFNALINKRGARVRHEKVTVCPNYIGPITSQQHDSNCTLCENSYIHFDPREFVGYFSTNEMVRSFFKGGWWEHGSALFSVPSYYPDNNADVDDQIYLNMGDRFTFLDYEDRFYEAIHMANDHFTKLRYKALKVEFLRTAKKIYEQEKQFILTADGDIEWLGADKPTKNLETGLGEIMTISYYYRPVYRVTKMLHEGRFTQKLFKGPTRTPIRMPQQVFIKKDFLIDKKDSDGNLILEPILP